MYTVLDGMSVRESKTRVIFFSQFPIVMLWKRLENHYDLEQVTLWVLLPHSYSEGVGGDCPFQPYLYDYIILLK